MTLQKFVKGSRAVISREAVDQLHQLRPFEPFTIRLSGGESHEVRHPENLAVGKQRLVVIDPESDRMAILGLLHVTSLETASAR
jgi:hypothetical protein